MTTPNDDLWERRQQHRRARDRYMHPITVTTSAAVTLYLAYVDLWNGGDTLSAILLVMGYIIMVPLAIMTVPRNRDDTEE